MSRGRWEEQLEASETAAKSLASLYCRLATAHLDQSDRIEDKGCTAKRSSSPTMQLVAAKRAAQARTSTTERSSVVAEHLAETCRLEVSESDSTPNWIEQAEAWFRRAQDRDRPRWPPLASFSAELRTEPYLLDVMARICIRYLHVYSETAKECVSLVPV